jgi:hypothetical protein
MHYCRERLLVSVQTVLQDVQFNPQGSLPLIFIIFGRDMPL